MLLNCGVAEDSWEFLGLQGDQTSQSLGNQPWVFFGRTDAEAPVLQSPNAKEMTHWKIPWCWERLRGEEGGDRGRDGWMALLTQWTWVWASPRRWWRTTKSGMLHVVQGVTKSQTRLSDWTMTIYVDKSLEICPSCYIYHSFLLLTTLPWWASQVVQW